MGVSVRTGYKACPECCGRGWNYSRFTTYAQTPCMACGGSGEVQDYVEFTLENIQIEIPQREAVAELRAQIADLEARIAVLEALNAAYERTITPVDGVERG